MTVDILFPYYGDVAMMKQAVLSVVGQTNPDWRLIVVDDGYPDDYSRLVRVTAGRAHHLHA